MGTNFYLVGHRHDGEIKYHIGKRSAAGRYCHDCGSTFCIDGTQSVHGGEKHRGWDNKCPCCGKSDENIKTYGAAMVELGFEKACENKPVGIGSASSFTWSMLKHKWDLEKKRHYKKKIVVDEYNRKYTPKEFLDMIERTCPIQFQMPMDCWS